MVRKRRVLLIGNQRSGSVYLERFLDSSPSVTFYGELLLGMAGPRVVSVPSALVRRRRLRHLYSGVRSLGLIHPRRVLSEAFDAAPTSVTGCRIMYNQLTPLVHRFLREERIEIIHLQRSHLLRQYVSRQQMRSRVGRRGPGHAHIASEPQKVPIAPKRLLRDMRRTARRAEQFTERYAHKIHLELTYEHAFSADGLTPSTAQSLRDFLSTGDLVEATTLSKTGASDLSTVISNWSEVVSCLARTEFAWMVSDPTALTKASELNGFEV